MKTALGLFHFNVQYVAGDSLLYHRYVTEAIIPFLDFIREDPRYRVSFEIAGNGLEFIATHYPFVIDTLRALINQGAIELISSTYAPTLWVAFPLRDLRKSIELNQVVLERLGLSAAPIFFSQEAFCGMGLKEVADFFSVILCKDDYVSYYKPALLSSSAYAFGGQKILIGRGHWRPLIQDVDDSIWINESSRSSTEFWYHMGSGHHLASPVAPSQWAHFYAEDAWIEKSRKCFSRMLDSDMRLGTIMEYASSLDLNVLQPWPFLPEGSWNAKASKGIYAWMGQLANQWEADGELLGIVWRARRLVRKLELALEHHSVTDEKSCAEYLFEAWKLLVLAESSDPYGWAPSPGEVHFGRVAAERVSQFMVKCSPCAVTPAPDVGSKIGKLQALASTAPFADVHFTGATGQILWYESSAAEQVCDIEFRATESNAGVRFEKGSDHCWYSPSGLEEHLQIIDPDEYACDELYLPLANGFISIGDDTHLVRANEFGQVAVALSKNSRWLSFVVSGTDIGRLYRWRFYLLRCDIRAASARANELNCT